MTTADAARELGIGRSALHSRIQRGEIRAIRVSPRLLLIPRSEVERWRGKGKQKPGPKRREQATREEKG